MEINDDVYTKAQLTRREFDVDALSPIDIFSIAKRIYYLTLVYYPFSEHISGLCLKNDKIKLIAINSNMSYGRQRFSLAHELYHLKYDDDLSMNICSMNIDSKNKNEVLADKFASYLLMPPTSLELLIERKYKNNKLSLNDVIDLEQYYQISHKAMLTRLLMHGYIDDKDLKKYEKNVKINAAKLGYSNELYEPKGPKKGTYGHYIKLIEELNDKDLMPISKINELLYVANREDLVPYNSFTIGGNDID